MLSCSIGWVIRNFFQTGIVERLAADFAVIVVATPKTRDGLVRLGYDRLVTIHCLEVAEEPAAWKLLRQVRKKVYMEGRRCTTEAIWEKYQRRPLYQRLGGAAVKGALRFADAYRLTRWLERLDYGLNRSRRLSNVISAYRPVLFFATHASSYFEELALRSALAAGIPAAFMILSWDHLSSKVVLSTRLRAVLVWNRRSQQELLKSYPTYRPEQVRVVGIPQYDAYSIAPAISYAAWCRRHGLDPSRRTILFSTMPQERHDQQHVIIERLLQAIVEGKQVPSDLQILVKCHPFDRHLGYEELRRHYPVAVYRNSIAPDQTAEDWTPSREEMDISRDCLFFCSININIFSTVTIEAAFFDKPVVHIAFDPQPVAGRIPCGEYYKLEHFKHIVDTNATTLVKNYEELLAAVSRYAAQPLTHARERRALVEAYVGQPVGTACDHVVEEIRCLCGGRAAGGGRRNQTDRHDAVSAR